MFESLSQRLQEIFRRLRCEAYLTEKTLQAGLRDIRLALLEADVHVDVVRRFIAQVRERALGAKVLESLKPAQQLVGVVQQEMARLLGGDVAPWRIPSGTPATLLLAGLQGAGKTTTANKLARWLRSAGRHPLLVAGDWRRPAAAEQLRQLAEQSGLPHHAPPGPLDMEALARGSREEARRRGQDLILIDTAGRLHVDQELMAELAALRQHSGAAEVFLVADSMTGQDAVRSAAEFHARVGLTGVILTKLDGDARGGAALSLCATVGVPIRFVGTGEGPQALEPFHPDRMASRILGMGDVVTLVERAQEVYQAEEAERAAVRLRRHDFTLDDLREQLRQLKRMGPLEQIVGLLPGMGALPPGLDSGEREFAVVESILDSMTLEERARPEIINGSRRRRVARGSGRSVSEVNRLLRQHTEMKRMLKSLSRRPGAARMLAGLAKGRR
ncbi:MAG: signal recognition particle protein [Acidobacteriota bacterium]